MLDFLNWILEHPVAAIFIAIFIIVCLSEIHFIENNHYYNGSEEEEDEN